jgi:hypothetical protein
MVRGLVVLDNELERQQHRIEQLESELFFERLRLVGLKTAKEALLSELAISRRQAEKNDQEAS